MSSLHFRNASFNTAFEPRPQSSPLGEGLSPGLNSPFVSHSRARSVGTTEKGVSLFEQTNALDQDAEPLLCGKAEPTSEERRFCVRLPRARAHKLCSSLRQNAVLAVGWVASLVTVSLFTYLLSVPRRIETVDSNLGSFASGFATELRDARSSITIRKQQFTGSLDFKDRAGFIPADSPSLAYVGATPEVDRAWEALSKDRYFLLSDEEAREAYGDNPAQYWNEHHGGWIAGLDVLHTLHCLNHLRMSLYPQTYPQDPVHGTMHKAHCIDHLRQLTMCSADLSPVPTQWFDGLQRNYINSSREHTCRDFSKIREWATERFNGTTAVKARNRDGSSRSNFYAPWSSSRP